MIVNFAVKQQGLEAQLLNTVVKQERADLDRQKNELVVKVAQGKRTQVSINKETSDAVPAVLGNSVTKGTMILRNKLCPSRNHASKQICRLEHYWLCNLISRWLVWALPCLASPA